MKKFTTLILFVIGCELVGLLATPFTLAAIPTWYAGLTKPFFSPPNWIFGPVWTTLYFLMGVSAFLVWQHGYKHKRVKQALQLFSLQLFFNFLWSFLFFGFQSVLFGLIDIFVLLFYIWLTFFAFINISRPAAYLLIPYFLWVNFAAILNLSIFILNP